MISHNTTNFQNLSTLNHTRFYPEDEKDEYGRITNNKSDQGTKDDIICEIGRFCQTKGSIFEFGNTDRGEIKAAIDELNKPTSKLFATSDTASKVYTCVLLYRKFQKMPPENLSQLNDFLNQHFSKHRYEISINNDNSYRDYSQEYFDKIVKFIKKREAVVREIPEINDANNLMSEQIHLFSKMYEAFINPETEQRQIDTEKMCEFLTKFRQSIQRNRDYYCGDEYKNRCQNNDVYMIQGNYINRIIKLREPINRYMHPEQSSINALCTFIVDHKNDINQLAREYNQSIKNNLLIINHKMSNERYELYNELANLKPVEFYMFEFLLKLVFIDDLSTKIRGYQPEWKNLVRACLEELKPLESKLASTDNIAICLKAIQQKLNSQGLS